MEIIGARGGNIMGLCARILVPCLKKTADMKEVDLQKWEYVPGGIPASFSERIGLCVRAWKFVRSRV